jgi:hypothetical protein
MCPTRQLTRDAERETSRRRPFLRTFRRLFTTFGDGSRPLEWPHESGYPAPVIYPVSDILARFFPRNSPTLGSLSSPMSYPLTRRTGPSPTAAVLTASCSPQVITHRANRPRSRPEKPVHQGKSCRARDPFSASPQAFRARQAAGIWQVPREGSSRQRPAPASHNMSLNKDLGKISRCETHTLFRLHKSTTCHN